MEHQPLVLVVDDDEAVVRLVRAELLDQGFRVVTAADGVEALRVADEERPDILVLDLGLPGMDGFEVMRHLAGRAPVLVLSARASDRAKIEGLERGADDYLGKPFNPEELGARVRAILRRVGEAEARPNVVRARDLAVDLDRRLVFKGGQLVELTRTEWNLLRLLAENQGRVLTSTEILTKAWGREYREERAFLRVWISRLRAKLEPERPEDSVIRNFPGIGYMLVASDAGVGANK